MKALGIILKIGVLVVVVMVAATLVVYFLGSRTYTYRAGVAIEAEPYKVYEHLTRPVLLEQWLTGLENMRPIDENGDPLLDEEGLPVNVGTDAAGARAAFDVTHDGTSLSMTSEVLGSLKGKSLEVQIEPDANMFTAISRYELEQVRNDDNPLSPHTYVHFTQTIEYHGLSRLMAPFMGSAIEAQLQDDLDRLKALAEDGSALDAALAEPERIPAPVGEVTRPQGSMGSDLPPQQPGADSGGDAADDDAADDDAADDDADADTGDGEGGGQP